MSSQRAGGKDPAAVWAEGEMREMSSHTSFFNSTCGSAALFFFTTWPIISVVCLLIDLYLFYFSENVCTTEIESITQVNSKFRVATSPISFLFSPFYSLSASSSVMFVYLFFADAARSLWRRFLNQLPTCVGVSPVAWAKWRFLDGLG